MLDSSGVSPGVRARELPFSTGMPIILDFSMGDPVRLRGNADAIRDY